MRVLSMELRLKTSGPYIVIHAAQHGVEIDMSGLHTIVYVHHLTLSKQCGEQTHGTTTRKSGKRNAWRELYQGLPFSQNRCKWHKKYILEEVVDCKYGPKRILHRLCLSRYVSSNKTWKPGQKIAQNLIHGYMTRWHLLIKNILPNIVRNLKGR